MQKRILVLLLAALLLLGCGGNDASVTLEPVANTSADEAVSASAASMRFTTTDVYGNSVNESLFEGYDLVMLNFWAYWCPPCIGEMPELAQLAEAYPNLLLVGVIVDDTDMDETLAIMENAGVTYPVLYPTGDLRALAQQCVYIPTTYFLLPDGTLSDPVVGANSYDGWAQVVEGYLS